MAIDTSVPNLKTHMMQLAIFELQSTGKTEMYFDAEVKFAAKHLSEKSSSGFENFSSEY